MKTELKTYRLPLNLQMFAEEGEGGQGGNGEGNQGGDGGQGGNGEGGNGTGGNAGGQGGAPDKKPAVAFDTEAAFMARMQREGKKMVGDFLKTLGFEKEDDLKTVITAHKDKIEADKTELQKAQDRATALEKAQAAAVTKLEAAARTSEAKVAALAAGVKPERLDYLLKLADLSEVAVNDGTADAAAVKAAVEKVLADMPELKGQAGQARGGGEFGGQGGGTGLTWEAIKAMSTKEVEARLPEITAFMAKNPKR